jgi:CHASE2 domain-containing sensor protein
MRFLKSLFSINPVSLTLCTILLVVLLFFAGIPILDLIELKTYDLRFLSRGQLPPSPAVVMALIDEKSLGTEGRWPWPRSKIATLVDLLSQDGARVIGFDIGFLEPDENSQLAFLNQFSQKVDALAIEHPQLADFINESKTHADKANPGAGLAIMCMGVRSLPLSKADRPTDRAGVDAEVRCNRLQRVSARYIRRGHGYRLVAV